MATASSTDECLVVAVSAISAVHNVMTADSSVQSLIGVFVSSHVNGLFVCKQTSDWCFCQLSCEWSVCV